VDRLPLCRKEADTMAIIGRKYRLKLALLAFVIEHTIVPLTG